MGQRATVHSIKIKRKASNKTQQFLISLCIDCSGENYKKFPNLRKNENLHNSLALWVVPLPSPLTYPSYSVPGRRIRTFYSTFILF